MKQLVKRESSSEKKLGEKHGLQATTTSFKGTDKENPTVPSLAKRREEQPETQRKPANQLTTGIFQAEKEG